MSGEEPESQPIEDTGSDSLTELAALAREFVDERDWQRYHSPRNMAMALSVEAAELLELYLWSADDGPQPRTDKQRAQVAHEAADVLLCLLNFCDQADVDLATAFREKLVLARAKYPVDQVRGRAHKWTEYLGRPPVEEDEHEGDGDGS